MTKLDESTKAKIRKHKEGIRNSLDLSMYNRVTPKCSDEIWMLLSLPLGNLFGGVDRLSLTSAVFTDKSSVTGVVLDSLGEPNFIMVF